MKTKKPQLSRTWRMKNKTYLGKPCKNCSSKEKYISTGACSLCTRQKANEMYMRFPEIIKERKRNFYKNNLDTNKDYKLRATYGISLEEYNIMLKKQNYVCAICNQECKSKRKLSVDHEHKSNKVRGLLCVNCNRAIGNLKDNVSLLRKAADYIEKYEK